MTMGDRKKKTAPMAGPHSIHLVRRSEDLRSQFHRRRDLAENRFISICRLCAKTVLATAVERDLDRAERHHVCEYPIFEDASKRF